MQYVTINLLIHISSEIERKTTTWNQVLCNNTKFQCQINNNIDINRKSDKFWKYCKNIYNIKLQKWYIAIKNWLNWIWIVQSLIGHHKIFLVDKVGTLCIYSFFLQIVLIFSDIVSSCCFFCFFMKYILSHSYFYWCFFLFG